MTEISDIRNIGIIAHIDAGKTTTTERLLYYTDTIHKMGEVHDGNTTTDWMEQEKERGITITSATITCFWKNKQINIIDTPGHVDFTAEVERSLRVLDGAIGIFCAVGGVEPQSETVWHQADKYSVPRIAYINKMDRLGADFENVLEMIKNRLTPNATCIQLPIGKEDHLTGIIDLVEMRTAIFNTSDNPKNYEYAEIPENLLEVAKNAREILIDKIADFDDELMLAFLEGDDISPSLIKRALRKGVIQNKIVPVLTGSSLKNFGVHLLLNAINDYLPSPTDITLPEVIDRTNNEKICLKTDPNAKFAALAFKVQIEKHTGKLVYIRVYSGTLKKGEIFYNQTNGKKERAIRLIQMQSNKKNDIDHARAGDIVALVGTKFTFTGDTITEENNPVLLSKMDFPESVISIAIEPKTKADQDDLSEALTRLEEEDPTFKVKQDKDTGQILITGMGELHLDIILDRLKREYNISVNQGNPQVTYKETITEICEVDEELRRELNNKITYGYVKLRLSPYDYENDPENHLQKKNKFINRVESDEIPASIIEAIKESAFNSCSDGPLLSGQIEGLQVELIDTAYHQGESNEVAYRVATGMAISKGLQKAGALILEPIMNVTIISPVDFIGDIIGDINVRRGRVIEIRTMGQKQEILAEIPLNEMFGYSTRIRSLSQGRAVFTMEFKKYEKIPLQLQQNLLKKIRGY
ncbi:MAG TPA: elongation factor G [Candidatus Cloacimonadota bacterium]|nr:elongation factor G [Candidatus Cloacimonadota bacterium]